MPIFKGYQPLALTRVQVELEEDGKNHTRLFKTDDAAVKKSLEGLKPGQLVTLETKVNPEDEGLIKIPILERISPSEQKG